MTRDTIKIFLITLGLCGKKWRGNPCFLPLPIVTFLSGTGDLDTPKFTILASAYCLNIWCMMPKYPGSLVLGLGCVHQFWFLFFFTITFLHPNLDLGPLQSTGSYPSPANGALHSCKETGIHLTASFNCPVSLCEMGTGEENTKRVLWRNSPGNLNISQVRLIWTLSQLVAMYKRWGMKSATWKELLKEGWELLSLNISYGSLLGR